MKASKFSDVQKAFILQQGADGVPVADICRRAGISDATYYNWKKKYDGLLPTEMSEDFRAVNTSWKQWLTNSIRSIVIRPNGVLGPSIPPPAKLTNFASTFSRWQKSGSQRKIDGITGRLPTGPITGRNFDV